VVTYDAILRVDNPDGKLRPGMTANVRIVCERRENVVRVPNAALRFKPAPELVLTSTADRGGRAGGRPGRGDGGAPGAGGGGWAGRNGTRRGGAGGPGAMGAAGAEGGRPRGAGATGADGMRISARVYEVAGEKVRPVSFRPGIADDEYTEVLGGPLSAGDAIVVEASGGSQQQGPQAPRASPAGGGRGRGPRFF
jgi:HlyD family secretion protein